MLVVAGALFVMFALLSLSASEGSFGRQRTAHVLYGALIVAAVVLVLAKAGFPWVGVALALLWGSARRR